LIIAEPRERRSALARRQAAGNTVIAALGAGPRRRAGKTRSLIGVRAATFDGQDDDQAPGFVEFEQDAPGTNPTAERIAGTAKELN
jgi:hypothetical protein